MGGVWNPPDHSRTCGYLESPRSLFLLDLYGMLLDSTDLCLCSLSWPVRISHSTFRLLGFSSLLMSMDSCLLDGCWAGKMFSLNCWFLWFTVCCNAKHCIRHVLWRWKWSWMLICLFTITRLLELELNSAQLMQGRHTGMPGRRGDSRPQMALSTPHSPTRLARVFLLLHFILLSFLKQDSG